MARDFGGKFVAMQDREQFILTVSVNGFGKRTSSYEYRVTGRGGKGIVAMAVNARNGELVASMPVEAGPDHAGHQRRPVDPLPRERHPHHRPRHPGRDRLQHGGGRKGGLGRAHRRSRRTAKTTATARPTPTNKHRCGRGEDRRKPRLPRGGGRNQPRASGPGEIAATSSVLTQCEADPPRLHFSPFHRADDSGAGSSRADHHVARHRRVLLQFLQSDHGASPRGAARRGRYRDAGPEAVRGPGDRRPAGGDPRRPRTAASLRFGQSGYIFAISLEGVSLLAPATPQVEGKICCRSRTSPAAILSRR